MNFVDLSPQVRTAMQAELQNDIETGRLYISPRLSPRGVVEYPRLLAAAIENSNTTWLATQLRGLLNANENYMRGGKQFTRKVPVNAAEQLAEGEFNRYYCRGLCCVVSDANPEGVVEVYRAKSVSTPRPESESLIGRQYNARVLLADIRAATGLETALGVPAGPNSGISIRKPARARDTEPDSLPAA